LVGKRLARSGWGQKRGGDRVLAGPRSTKHDGRLVSGQGTPKKKSIGTIQSDLKKTGVGEAPRAAGRVENFGRGRPGGVGHQKNRLHKNLCQGTAKACQPQNPKKKKPDGSDTGDRGS